MTSRLNVRHRGFRNVLFLAMICLATLSASVARAEMLNLRETVPDIFCAGITVDYSASSHVFSTTHGYPCGFTYPSPGDPGEWMYIDTPDLQTISPLVYAPWPVNGFAITGTLDDNNQPTGGTLEIRGYIPALQGLVPGETDPNVEHPEYYDWANTSVLLTGDFKRLGYNVFASTTQDGRDIYINTMEMVFDTTGGFLANRYSAGQIGINISWESFIPAATIGFDHDFNSDAGEGQQLALGDVFVVPVPEPSSAVLLLITLCGALWYSRRRFWGCPEPASF